MEKRNIYKTDDVLIIGSFLMLIPAVYFSWPWLSGLPSAPDLTAYVQSAPELLGTNLLLAGAYLGGAVVTQILGRVLHNWEKQTLDILDTVMYMGQVSISQLAGNLSLSESKVRKLTVRLCRVRRLGISLAGDMISRKIAPPPFAAASSPAQDIGQAQTEKPASPSPESSTETTAGSESSHSSAVEISSELRDYLKKDKSDIFSKLEKINRIAESGGKITPEELEKTDGDDKGKPKITKGKIILLFFLFMTPLWPVALIIIIVQVVKNYKKLKEKGMADLHVPSEE